MEKFRQLGIIEPILISIQEQKFEVPSEIQEKSIPLIIEGRDVIAGASTGSGKTLAFASGIIKNCERGEGIQSLVLTPTRELAEQVSSVIQKFSKNKKLNITSVYGGVSINPQIDSLRKTDIVVGTPGRILDHLNRRTINFNKLKILVLDEADRMLDMGFLKDVGKIIENCPKKRQTLLFSATISKDISYIAQRYMNNAVKVSAEAYVDPSKLTQVYYDVEDDKKFSLLVHFLKNENSGLVMIFCNTQRTTDFVYHNLNDNGINALAIHGGYSQEKRKNTMERFSSQKTGVLVCTDVAARGLDIKGVLRVYNYEMPRDSNEYIHRIGRTARAGNEGKVINIIASRDYENFQKIINHEEFNLIQEQLPEIERVFVNPRNQRSRRSFGDRDSHFGNRNSHSFGRRDNNFRGNREDRGNRDNNGFRGHRRSFGNREDRGSRDNRRYSGNNSRGHSGFGRRSSGNRNSNRSFGRRSRY